MLFVIGFALCIEFFQICFFECYYHLRAKIRNISDVRKFMNAYFMFDEKKTSFSPCTIQILSMLWSISMPRPPHLALMCVRQLTDRLSKRSGDMGNCLLLPQRFLFPTHWNPHCIGINGWIMRKQRLQLRCHVIVGRNNIKEIFNHTKAEIYLLLVYSG